MTEKLIHDGTRWRVAELVSIKKYGPLVKEFPNATHVWSDPQTTAFICPKGEERAAHDLPVLSPA